MGHRAAWFGFLLVGCGSSGGAELVATPDAAPDVAPVAEDAGADASDAASDASDAAPDAHDAGADGPCVPKTQAEACAGKNCGLVSDGCSSGYQCTGPGAGDAGGCPNQQVCGLQVPNVCGGCVPIPSSPDSGAPECTTAPYVAAYSCPIITVDGETSAFAPPGPGQCVNKTATIACCFY